MFEYFVHAVSKLGNISNLDIAGGFEERLLVGSAVLRKHVRVVGVFEEDSA